MSQRQCTATHTRKVAGVAYVDGRPLPFAKEIEERCLLPEHTGRHMFPMDDVGGYSIVGEDGEQ